MPLHVRGIEGANLEMIIMSRGFKLAFSRALCLCRCHCPVVIPGVVRRRGCTYRCKYVSDLKKHKATHEGHSGKRHNW
jgi:hypothetical protein